MRKSELLLICMWFTFFPLVFKRPALDSIRRLKANIVLTNQGLGWELFTFTSALNLLSGLVATVAYGGFKCLFGPCSFNQVCCVLFYISDNMWVVGWRKVELHRSFDPIATIIYIKQIHTAQLVRPPLHFYSLGRVAFSYYVRKNTIMFRNC